jgi:hypothetical protein
MRCAFSSAAGLFVAACTFGCGPRCDDRGQGAIQAVLPQLNQVVVSNLIHEASQCIASALAQSPIQPFYNPAWADVPVAHGLKVGSSSEFSISTGPTISVRTRGSSAPYMAVGVPVHFAPGLCLWTVYVCIKPGGGFAKDSTNWNLAERGANATPVVEVSDEVLLYAEQQSF